jgi:hypothetical protein
MDDAAGEVDARVVFAAYHRGATARRVRAALVGFAVAGLVGGGLSWVVSATLPAPASAVAAASPSASPVVAPAVESAPAPTVLPADAPVAPAPSAPAPPVAAGPLDIRITASGYQAELDQCQWVRMDIGAIAPIVGAHTRCGGAAVLTLQTGDRVELHGEGLDGAYVVGEARDAHAGDDAATATSGLAADVILQSCYVGTTGRVRLVALEKSL